MQEVVIIVCVIVLLAFFFSPYDLRMDEDDE